MKQPEFIFECKKCPAVLSVDMMDAGWVYTRFRKGVTFKLGHEGSTGNIMCFKLNESGESVDTKIIEDDRLVDVLEKAVMQWERVNEE